MCAFNCSDSSPQAPRQEDFRKWKKCPAGCKKAF